MKTMAKQINRILAVLLSINIVLATIKLFGGFSGNALTLVGDGLNSLGDVFTSLLLLIVIRIANKKPDKNHPYGHQKYEGIVHFVIGLVVLVTAIFVIKMAVDNLVIYFVRKEEIETPDIITIVVAGISIFLKGIMVVLARIGHKKYHSVALRGASIDYISDFIITSVGLIGIVIARAGLVYFDAIASLIIAVIIIVAAFGIIKESVSFLVDQSPGDDIVNPIAEYIKSLNGVIDVDDLKVVMHMNRLYVDVEISVSAKLSLLDSHQIAEDVHEGVEKKFDDVIHCMVHVNPFIKTEGGKK